MTTALLSAARVARMRKWLDDCEASHPHCDTNRQFYYDFQLRPPKRFIDVGNPGQVSSIRLVEMDSAPRKPYAALSYCWGPTEENYTTTVPRLDEHKRQLPWDSLPKTIKHAIIVTQLLGIPYLWVDALCIVQNSESGNGDWAQEASKMAGLYRHARVTLAALSAPSSTQGFLIDITHRLPPSALSRDSDLYDSMQETPHAKRGWTFQELLLSTSIIHFYDGWMIWECRSAKGVENTPLKDMIQGVFVKELRDVKPRSQPNSNQSNWWSWVNTYTSRSLTHTSDRPAAICGVIGHYSYRVEDERMTGLWQQNLLQDLLWRALKPGKRIPTSSIKMPTWSWLSIDALICAPRSVDLGNSIFRPVAKIIDIGDRLLFHTGTPDSWIGSSTLILQGKLQPARVSKGDDGTYQLRVVVDGVAQEPQHCWIDCEDEVPSTGQVFCFWIALLFGYPGIEQYATREALVLTPAKEGSYHRIGACKVRAEKLYAESQITRQSEPGRYDGISFAPIDKENLLKLGFLEDDVTITLR